jgi:hypothetical protein
VKAEGVVLEGCAVPVTHQESDQAGVRVVDLVPPAGEADAGPVHDGEVVGHRCIEAHEAVVENGYANLRGHSVGYHFGRGRHRVEASALLGR